MVVPLVGDFTYKLFERERGTVSKDVVKTIVGEINSVPGNDVDGALCP